MKIEEVLANNLSALMDSHPALDTLVKVSKKSGIGYGTVRRIKSGTVSTTVGMLEDLAKAFGVSIQDLTAPHLGHRPPEVAEKIAGNPALFESAQPSAPVSAAPGPAITPEDAALLAAFHRLDGVERELAIADLEHRARTAEIRRRGSAPPPDTLPTPKDPPSALSRDRRAG